MKEQAPTTAEHVRDVFEQSMGMLCTASADGYFVHINPRWGQVLGYPNEQLQAVPFEEFIHLDDREATKTEFAQLAENAQNTAFTNRFRCANGSYK
jgi:PAS domain S-box-containing protein